MIAFNVVRFHVKLGQDEAFLEAHRNGKVNWPGLLDGHIIKTGEQTYCLIGRWPSQAVMTWTGYCSASSISRDDRRF